MREPIDDPTRGTSADGISWARVSRAVAAGLFLAAVLMQWRLLGFALLASAGALCAIPALRRARFRVVMALVITVVLFLPFDVALGSFHYGSRRGSSSGGPHLVRFVVGMPRHTRLIQTHGEYISGGCAWGAPIPPRWIWVWD